MMGNWFWQSVFLRSACHKICGERRNTAQCGTRMFPHWVSPWFPTYQNHRRAFFYYDVLGEIRRAEAEHAKDEA